MKSNTSPICRSDSPPDPEVRKTAALSQNLHSSIANSSPNVSAYNWSKAVSLRKRRSIFDKLDRRLSSSKYSLGEKFSWRKRLHATSAINSGLIKRAVKELTGRAERDQPDKAQSGGTKVIFFRMSVALERGHPSKYVSPSRWMSWSAR